MLIFSLLFDDLEGAENTGSMGVDYVDSVPLRIEKDYSIYILLMG